MSPAIGLKHSLAMLSLALLSRCTAPQEADPLGTWQAQIFSPLRGSPVLGQNFSISCEGNSTFPESIMYWLANNSFVSTLYPTGAVRETKTIETATSTGLLLNQTLSFHPFTQRDLYTKFECIILDPAGVARKTITWVIGEAPMEEETKGKEDTDGSGVHQNL